MSTAITLQASADVQYVLRLADTALILAQRLSEWCGHAPVLEEDIALTNMSLDLVGQSRALLTHAGQLHAKGGGKAYDEDQLAFLREERDFLNPTLCELPNTADEAAHRRSRPGDFAFTVLRNLMVATWLKQAWTELASSRDGELAAIAAKAVKEARYHQQHNGDWVVRLGDGTDDSHARAQRALERLWPFVPELFEDDHVDEAAAQSGLGPRASDLRGAWEAEIGAVLEQATLQQPKPSTFRSMGRRGVHSEHMGYLLAEMQSLQRAHPGAVW
ncbi:MAG: phenylacetate-CoA oxygenase subunit PaaI [Betaproteobacteria bacterium]|jgi:ring-1,2-phenylacetyl-CoA epoxidase subunit PaaC|nr:phenylacetate-CoA oxygenase subunit PaaI [Betaproteobacteria bacterium]NBT09565.1 phenylacetate-CoA oxygenase subunit PaaI [Betaproteobacteria bacterium]NBU48662.1 phenylacetate-CoA oxygenase subunit PaaI [Betaproteobacteria bacterium]